MNNLSESPLKKPPLPKGQRKNAGDLNTEKTMKLKSHISLTIILTLLSIIPVTYSNSDGIRLSPHLLFAKTANPKNHPKYPKFMQHYRDYQSAYQGGNYNSAIKKAKLVLETGLEIYGPNDPAMAAIYNTLGRTYNSSGDYNRAIIYNKKALAVLEKNGRENSTYAGTIYLEIGRSLFSSGNADGAIAAGKKAEEIYKKNYGPQHLYVAYAWELIASGESMKGNYNRVIALNRKAMSVYRKTGGETETSLGRVYINIGEAYRAMGDFNRAMEHHRMALKIYQKKLGEGSTYTATAYNYIGGVYKSMADYPRAIAHYKKSCAIYIKVLGEKHSFVATSYVNIGGAYELHNQLDETIEYYKKALPIYRTTLGENHVYMAVLYNNLGLANRRKGDLKQGLAWYRKALALYSKTLPRSHPYIAIALVNLADLNKEKDNSSTALSLYKKAVKIASGGTDRTTTIEALDHLAEMYRHMNRTDDEASTYEKIISLVLKYRIEIGRGKEDFTGRYIRYFNRMIQYELSRKNYSRAFILDSMRRGLSITENMSLRDALRGGSVLGEDREKLLASMSRIEKLKSTMTALSGSGKKNEADIILQKIWKEEEAMQAIDASLIKKYPRYGALRNPRAPSIREIQNKLRHGEAIFSYSLSGTQPVIFIITAKGNVQVINLDKKEAASLGMTSRNLHTIFKSRSETAELLKIRTAEGKLIVWNRSLEKSRYHQQGEAIYTGTTRGITVAKRPGTDSTTEEQKKLGTIEGRMSPGEADKYADKLCRSLYKILIKPALDKTGTSVNRLIIIPDGPLYYIPFGLLRRGNGRILHESYQHTLIHSSIVWNILRSNRVKRKWRYPLLAVGNAIYRRGHSLDTNMTSIVMRRSYTMNALQSKNQSRGTETPDFPNLPGTAREVAAISKMVYGSERFSLPHTLTGIKANEDIISSMVKSGRIRNYRVIHFAAHGMLVDNAPSLNALVLTMPHIAKRHNPKEYARYKAKYGKPLKDGFLRLDEIKTLRLNADLVVMSACETSLGKDISGEGMVGLPQAFLIGGSGNVIASLWAVDDAATGKLMELVYQNMINKKLPPAEALRQAQLKLRSNKKYSSPYFWAAFSVYGD